MCLDDKVVSEPENEYGLTPLHIFLGLAFHCPDLGFLRMVNLMNSSYNPDQQYQGILRQLVPNDVGSSFNEENIANNENKKHLVDLMGQGEYKSQLEPI